MRTVGDGVKLDIIKADLEEKFCLSELKKKLQELEQVHICNRLPSLLEHINAYFNVRIAAHTLGCGASGTEVIQTVGNLH